MNHETLGLDYPAVLLNIKDQRIRIQIIKLHHANLDDYIG